MEEETQVDMSDDRLKKIEKARKDIIEAMKDLHPSEGISLMEMIKSTQLFLCSSGFKYVFEPGFYVTEN